MNAIQQEALNISTVKEDSRIQSNYRLLDAPIGLRARIYPVTDFPEAHDWENEGGAVAPVDLKPIELFDVARSRGEVRIRSGRKQIAARMVVPRESVRVVNMTKPAPIEVVEVRLRGGGEEDVKVAQLEHRIKELMELADRPRILAERRAASIKRLESMFAGRKVR